MDAVDLAVFDRLAREPAVPELLADRLAAGRWALESELVRLDLGATIEAEVVEDALAWLAQVLSGMTNALVCQRFAAFRRLLDPFRTGVTPGPGDAPPGSPRGILDAYVAWETGERLMEADGPYPALHLALDRATVHWLAAVIETLERARDGRPAIAAIVDRDAAGLGPLTRATFGLSDPHAGGRAAAILRFEDASLFYKPRSVHGEAVWGDLATVAIGQALGLDLRTPGVSEHGAFGFMELVYHAPCATVGAVERCYRRYGGLLALAHGLGTCDLHHENVVVAGEHPVVVDAETILKGRLGLSEHGRRRLAFENQLALEGIESRESILETAILPLAWIRPLFPDEGGSAWEEIAVGALSAHGEEGPVEPVVCGRGSDDLGFRMVSVRPASIPNLPAHGGRTQRPAAWIDTICEAFAAVHDVLARSGRDLLATSGAADRLRRGRGRLIARPTLEYSAVLARSLNPGCLDSVETRRQRIEHDLSVLSFERLDAIGDLREDETAALLAGDIPRFEVDGESSSVGAGRLTEPPMEATATRLGTLDGRDLELQTVTIRHVLGRPAAGTGPAPERPAAGAAQQRALDIVGSLVRAARSADAEPWWPTVNYAPGLATTMVHSDREALYEGGAGTALVIAEAGRATGCDEWLGLATRLFRTAVRGRVSCVSRGGGLGRGLGGLVYALLRTGRATGCEELIDAAEALLTENGPTVAEHDPLDELLHGRAGLLLAALALYRERPRSGVLGVADSAALMLVARARRTAAGACWPVGGRLPLPLVSHGASGIAMALARWAALRGDDAAARLAEAALEWDDQAWVPEERGWRDGRLEGGPVEHATSWTWCNGRAGMLLARAAVAVALGRRFADGLVLPALQAPVDDAVRSQMPGLCCGPAGILDAALEVEARSEGGALREVIDCAASHLLDGMPESLLDPLNGTLFAGAAGAAFALLRSVPSLRVPSLLWFE